MPFLLAAVPAQWLGRSDHATYSARQRGAHQEGTPQARDARPNPDGTSSSLRLRLRDYQARGSSNACPGAQAMARGTQGVARSTCREAGGGGMSISELESLRATLGHDATELLMRLVAVGGLGAAEIQRLRLGMEEDSLIRTEHCGK